MKVFTSKGEIKTKQITSVGNLDDVGDVDASSPSDGEVLTFVSSSGNWEPSSAGAGDMSSATYDPASVSEQLVGETAAQTLTNKTLTQPTITLKQGASVAPTSEGDVQWDTDDDQIKVGDGSGTKVFSDDSVVQDRANHTGTQSMSTISDAGALATQDTVGTAEIDDEAVTLAKIQHIATDSLLGRDSASTGDVEVLTASQVRTILNVEDGATADQSDAEIKTAYENNADTNAFTDLEKSKLAGIDNSATANPNAIETDASGEISALTEKASPVSGDHLLIEDSADSDSKKRVQIGNLPASTPAADSITNTELANMSADTIKGRANGAGTGDPQDLTATQVRTILNVEDGANNYSHPNHTGDVTSSGDGATTIASNVVDNTKLATVSTSTIKGRVTAGTGNVEDLTATQARSILNVEDGANNYSHPNHTGDVTSVGDGSTTIVDEAVTLAKMQHIATDSFLGRDTAGTGDVEVLDAATARSILNVEDGADATDATNVAAAGAVMDSDISSNGVVARTGSGSYAARSVAGGTGIDVTNGDGVSGDPTVAIDSTVATLTGSQALTNKDLTDSSNKLRHVRSISIESPTDSEDITLFHTSVAITITRCVAVLRGSSTPSVSYNIKHAVNDRSAAGNSLWSSDEVITSTTSEDAGTTFNDDTVAADSFVWLETSAQSGTVDELHVTLEYTED